jgi:hypothetical protein
MTDFLSRLAERSSGRAAVAHPVVPPLFAAGPALPAEPADDGALGASSPIGEPPAPSGAPAPRAEARREAPGEPAAPAAALPEPRLAPPLVPSLANSRAPDIAVEGRLIAAARHTGAPAEDGRGTAASSPASPEPSRPPATATARLVPLVPLPARVTASLPRPASPEPDPARTAPIVHISIGRIDVRAVSPSKPAAPALAPVRTEARLSLEEYLKPRDRRP